MKNLIHRIRSIFLLGLLVLFCTNILIGCQSTDKSEAYFHTTTLTYDCIYNDKTDSTEISWNATITNGTIYRLNHGSFKFKLYDENDDFLDTRTTNYDLSIGNGKSSTSTYSFSAVGNVKKIAFDGWSCEFDGVWQTYKVWFIVIIVVVAVALLIYVVVMIVEDLEIGDTVEGIIDFFEEHGWVAVSFLLPLAGLIYGIISSYWVAILIVLSGIVAFVLLILLAHLIRFIVESIADVVDFSFVGGGGRSRASISPENGGIADYLNDREALMSFTVEQLKDYCRENDIRGYSSLHKAALVDLIMNSGTVGQAPDGQAFPTTGKTSPAGAAEITFDDIVAPKKAEHITMDDIL